MKKNRAVQLIWCFFQLILLVVVIINTDSERYNAALCIVLISLIGNIYVSYINRKQQVIALLFYVTMFLFLLGRPFVSLLRGDNWWIVASTSAISKALISIEIVFVFLPLGFLLIKQIDIQKQILNIEANIKDIDRLRKAAFFVLLLGLVSSFGDGLQKMSYMALHSYTEYYIDYTSNLPLIFKALVRLMKPSLCLYLATFPTKKSAFKMLMAYVFTTLPYLVIGMRSPTMLALLFCFTYYCIRDYLYPNGERWIGKFEKLSIIIATPLLISFSYAYNYIRTGRDYTIDTDILLDFLYQQGVSFNYLSQGFDIIGNLPLKGWPGYMLGPSYDNIVYGSIVGRTLFGTPAISTQSMDAITIGHDMKQHLSYALMGNSYLMGYGTGAVFILEVIHDIGWIGLVLYSIFLGWFLMKIMYHFVSTKLITSTILIYAILQIFYVPRSDALYFLEQVINPYFWITILLITIISKLNIRKKLRLSDNGIRS